MPATMSAVLTSARLSSWVPVNTSNVGAIRGQRVRRAGADQREEDQPPPAPTVRERDGHQRHQHAGACHRQGDPEGLVRPVEGAGDRVAVLRQQRTAEVREQGDRGQGAEPARLLRRERHRWDDRKRLDGRGRWRPGQRGLEAGGGVGERAPRPSQAWMRRNQVKKGTTTSLTASRRTSVVGPADDRTTASSPAVVSGMPSIGPAKPEVVGARARLSTRARHTWSLSASTVISIERRTCGMLRRPRLEESPACPSSPQATVPQRSRSPTSTARRSS